MFEAAIFIAQHGGSAFTQLTLGTFTNESIAIGAVVLSILEGIEAVGYEAKTAERANPGKYISIIVSNGIVDSENISWVRVFLEHLQ